MLTENREEFFMEKNLFKLIGGGGNSLKPSHNQDFNLIEAFNNLAPWGEKKFVSEQERTYKFQRGVNNILDCHTNACNDVKCHAEDKSPKYRMVGKMKGNNFFDKVHSLFTTHHSLKRAGATHVALCESVGSYFRHWCGAFTLAEVLVTLGIIGVVSAMTVPTLMQNYQRQSYVTQLHKTYNEFSQAILRFQTDRNAVNLTEAGLTSQEVCNNLMTSYFKTTQTCENSLTPCFADSYKTLQGGTIDFDINTSYVLASGASVRFMYAQVGNGINKIANITVDVNGKKGPNILGRDLFWMALYNDGVIDDYDYKSPAPLSESLRNDAYDTYCQGSGVVPGYGCFGRILNNNWEMNY